MLTNQKEEKPVTIKDNKPKKVKKKITPEQEIHTLEQLKLDIISNGYYSMKISSLFGLFNYQKRSSVNIDKVLNRLEDAGLFAAKRVVVDRAWGERIKIYNFPVDQLGHLFKSENEMEKAFAENQWYRQLDLMIKTKPEKPGERSDQQFSPNGTRDRLDFRALDKNGHNVVLELKNKGGDKRLIEQALRYRTDLMHHFKTDQVSCIIITGERCLHTAKAFKALPAHEKKVITWYLYKWDKNNSKQISFEEVTLDFINRYLAPNSVAPLEKENDQ